MASRERPLSPHLQVYRWQIQMIGSILHRATGIVLAVGALIIAGGLLTLMMGPESWACFTEHAGAWYGKAYLFGWSWAFSYHICNGIRHMSQDFSIGMSIPAFVRNSWMAIIGSLVITTLIWTYVLMNGGAA